MLALEFGRILSGGQCGDMEKGGLKLFPVQPT